MEIAEARGFGNRIHFCEVVRVMPKIDMDLAFLERLPWLFLNLTMVEFLRYVLAAGLMALIVFFIMRTRWRVRKIQQRKPTADDLRREIFSSIRTAIVFAIVGIVFILLNRAGLTHLYINESRNEFWTSLFVLAVMFLSHDAYFYWTHRAMHSRLLYKPMHLHHHRSVTPTPWAAYSLSTSEAFVQASFVPIFLAIVPMYFAELTIFATVQIVRNAWGHCGVELEPRSMPVHRFLGIFTTTAHHDLHHSGHMAYNFGFYLTLWDRLMKTQHPDYVEFYDSIFERDQGTGTRGSASQGANANP